MVLRKQNGRGINRSKNNGYSSSQNSQRNRGVYKQNLDRYLGLARDAAANGDEITAEGYRQHAEHFFRQLKDSEFTEHREHRKPQGTSHTSSAGTSSAGDRGDREVPGVSESLASPSPVKTPGASKRKKSEGTPILSQLP